MQEKIIVPVDRTHLAELRSLVRKRCLQGNVSSRTVQRIVLVVDEAVSNVMEHSRSDPDDVIRISLEIAEDNIVIEITDHGIEFDPCKPENIRACRNTSVKKPFKRGFGLHLIHLITDSISYCRTEGNENRLILVIEDRDPPEGPSPGRLESAESCLD
ncbi:MAG: ATP-binding protein [Planctomycetes bacterium]|nr:ATP-binding protein [Planctomycetota bacterium]